MKRSLCVVVMLACAFSSNPSVLAQSDNLEDLRGTLQLLQQRLSDMENADTSSATRQRTTQLGRSKVVINDEPELIVQIYDMSDLLAQISPYPAMVTSDIGPYDTPSFPAATGAAGGFTGTSGMGGMGGMGGGMYNVMAQQSGDGKPDGSRSTSGRHYQQPVVVSLPGGAASPAGLSNSRISMEDLIDAITATIEPNTWDAVGGQGSISPLGNNLLIRTTPQTHKQITALFDTFRKKWGTLKTVSVQAHWLWLSEEEAASVLEDEKKAGDFAAFGVVNDIAWDKLVKQLRDNNAGERPTGYQAVITCYNGQTVSVQSGAQRRVVAGMIPVIDGGGQEGAVGYQPQMATLQEGASLQITPAVTSGGKLVVLDIHSRVVLLREETSRGPLERESEGATGKSQIRDLALALDRPSVTTQRIQTTLRTPVAKRMLVGGMTFEAQPEPGQPSLYLFVKPLVQELRDDAPTATKPEAGKTEVKPQVDEKAKPKG